MVSAQDSAKPKPKSNNAKSQAQQQAKIQGPQPTEKKVYKEAGDTKLELWIWKPEGWKAEDKRGAVVFYHGGGWRNGSPMAFSRQSAELAKLGMVAISVQYRLTSQSGVTIPDCVKDARSAFRWVRSHATELGIDPTKIAAGGGSAGGHLAATLATLDEVNDAKDDLSVSTKPAALLLFNPAVKLDFRRATEVTATKQEELLKVSPYHHLKAGHPPTIIFHGDADNTVPIDTVQAYAAKVKELGGTCVMEVSPGDSHGYFNREPAYTKTLEKSISFLREQGLLAKE
ncbi:acetyl esterase/lipase [Roseimicrobium gellanilyticum]|uniref:Acetyl esterase/lipase n=1 Tax=Roseimicrobium gellanilyticum TaxID=748857 RepID=A0A366HEF0_9BACT|nr:alpha/beta hydrolase [Roseimicrobium gellanilyticum]RBP39688.1 acetyl esterase/lipase [Roseimicrobium gellanilyticum]